MSSQVLCPFLNWIVDVCGCCVFGFFFFLLLLLSSFCILGTSFLSDMCFANIMFRSVSCLFILWMAVFTVQSFLVWGSLTHCIFLLLVPIPTKSLRKPHVRTQQEGTIGRSRREASGDPDPAHASISGSWPPEPYVPFLLLLLQPILGLSSWMPPNNFH